MRKIKTAVYLVQRATSNARFGLIYATLKLRPKAESLFMFIIYVNFLFSLKKKEEMPAQWKAQTIHLCFV